MPEKLPVVSGKEPVKVLVKLKKEPVVKTKIDAPEDIVLEVDGKDIEELV